METDVKVLIEGITDNLTELIELDKKKRGIESISLEIPVGCMITEQEYDEKYGLGKIFLELGVPCNKTTFECNWMDDITQYTPEMPEVVNEDVKGKVILNDKKCEVELFLSDRRSGGRDGKLTTHDARVKLTKPTEYVGPKGLPIVIPKDNYNKSDVLKGADGSDKKFAQKDAAVQFARDNGKYLYDMYNNYENYDTQIKNLADMIHHSVYLGYKFKRINLSGNNKSLSKDLETYIRFLKIKQSMGELKDVGETNKDDIENIQQSIEEIKAKKKKEEEEKNKTNGKKS